MTVHYLSFSMNCLGSWMNVIMAYMWLSISLFHDNSLVLSSFPPGSPYFFPEPLCRNNEHVVGRWQRVEEGDPTITKAFQCCDHATSPLRPDVCHHNPGWSGIQLPWMN